MTICKKCKKEYERVGSWCGHDISDEFGDYFSLSYEDKGVEFCGECAKQLETKVKSFMTTLVDTDITKRLTAEDGNYKKFPIKEALVLMSDEWIDDGEYCAQDLVDLRDILKQIFGI